MDNYTQTDRYEDDDPESAEVLCPYCFHITRFYFFVTVNRCEHCSIIINEEDVIDVQP